MVRNFCLILTAFILTNCASTTLFRSKVHDQKGTNSSQQIDKPYVLLISIDGYRYDYTDKFKPPHLLKFRQTGSFAKALRPTFPSKTFPNHYSIVTGLHAGHHGVVANKFYSQKTQSIFQLRDREAVTNPVHYEGMPIWVSAEKQGMLSASYFWPGSEAKIKGVYPNYYYTYNHSTPHKERTNQIIRWFQLPENKRPHFVTLYFSDVDSAGHKYGTQSKELGAAIQKVDASLGELFVELKKLPFKVNVVIVSDHGMVDVVEKKVEYLSDFLTEEDVKGLRFVDEGPQMFVYGKNRTTLNKLYKKLKFDAMGAHFRVYKKKELPKKFNYSRHANIGDLVIMTKPPYTVCLKKGCRFNIGVHGYDPYKFRSMHGILYMKGPQVVSGKRLPVISNVHIYPALHEILGLSVIGPHDGDIDQLKSVLKH